MGARARLGTCLVCCGPAAGGFAHCFACRAVARLLRLALTPVLPLRLCAVPGPLYTVLMGYKESPVDSARKRFARIVGAHFAEFFNAHGPCVRTVLGGGVDFVLPVPSSSRPGAAPLELVKGLPELVPQALGDQARWMPSLLRRSGAPVGHMRPHAEAFSPASGPAVRRSKVVLLDDIYVSGARSQSAAAALRRCGAAAVVIVPLGRVLRPDRLSTHAVYLEGVHRVERMDRFRVDPTGRGCCRCVSTEGAGDQAVPMWSAGNVPRRPDW